MCLYGFDEYERDPLDTEHQEELEDEIKRVLRKFEVKAKMRSLSTGNEMTIHLHQIEVKVKSMSEGV